ncbi:MAG: sugar phosphate isomerase/epimerase [Nitrospirae bacterium]|nr:sugar phosphate isomerase/epimerase [Nitrospirota bacterium]
MHEIGVMQGRLVPQIDGRIQAFPWKRWRDEFELAKTYEFRSIEFVFELDRFQENPIYTDSGNAELCTLIEKTGVPVTAICADYFMDRPLFRVRPHAQEESVRVLERLIECAARVGAERVEIPCVDHASIVTEDDKRDLLTCVSGCLKVAERHSIEIVFETSLPPEEFRDLLERFRHPLMKANYDTGNSASLGYDPVHELTVLGELVANIHIKDRVLHGSTVPLGSGHADFPAIFSTLAKIGYKGPFILQTARDPDDIDVAIRYRDMVRSYLRKSFA